MVQAQGQSEYRSLERDAGLVLKGVFADVRQKCLWTAQAKQGKDAHYIRGWMAMLMLSAKKLGHVAPKGQRARMRNCLAKSNANENATNRLHAVVRLLCRLALGEEIDAKGSSDHDLARVGSSRVPTDTSKLGHQAMAITSLLAYRLGGNYPTTGGNCSSE